MTNLPILLANIGCWVDFYIFCKTRISYVPNAKFNNHASLLVIPTMLTVLQILHNYMYVISNQDEMLA